MRFRDSLKTLTDKKNIVGCEIGTAEGKNACSILENLDIKKLYLIDPYLFSDAAMKSTACENLKEYEDKIERFEDLSENVINKIPNDLDFVYIDGNHTYPHVLKDLELYYPKVKSGGLITCHDFNLTSVQKAINTFFNSSLFENKKTTVYVGFGGDRPEAWVIKNEED